MSDLIMITSFEDKSPTRHLIRISSIISISGFGTGRDSGTEIELVGGTVIGTSIWDTDWPTMLEMAAASEEAVYVFDRRPGYGTDEQVEEALDTDKYRLFGIKPRGHETTKESSKRMGRRRSGRSGRQAAPTEHVGERGVACAMRESEVDMSTLVQIPDGNDTLLVCGDCADVAVSEGEVDELALTPAHDLN